MCALEARISDDAARPPRLAGRRQWPNGVDVGSFVSRSSVRPAQRALILHTSSALKASAKRWEERTAKLAEGTSSSLLAAMRVFQGRFVASSAVEAILTGRVILLGRAALESQRRLKALTGLQTPRTVTEGTLDDELANL